jgi:nitroreductase
VKILEIIKKRRSVGRFALRVVEKEKIDRVAKAACYDPPEGQKAPIKIVVISKIEIKQKIRQTAEQIEKAYIQGAGNGHGNRELELQLGETGWRKPFLEEAPYLIIACSLVGQPYQAASTWLALGRIMLYPADARLLA